MEVWYFSFINAFTVNEIIENSSDLYYLCSIFICNVCFFSENDKIEEGSNKYSDCRTCTYVLNKMLRKINS